MRRDLEIRGIVDCVYEDLGPSCKMVVLSEEKDGGSYTFDISELPCSQDLAEKLVGRRVRIKTTSELELLEGIGKAVNP